MPRIHRQLILVAVVNALLLTGIISAHPVETFSWYGALIASWSVWVMLIVMAKRIPIRYLALFALTQLLLIWRIAAWLCAWSSGGDLVEG